MLKLMMFMVVLHNGDYDHVCATSVDDAWEQIPAEHYNDIDYIERNDDTDYEDWECEVD